MNLWRVWVVSKKRNNDMIDIIGMTVLLIGIAWLLFDVDALTIVKCVLLIVFTTIFFILVVVCIKIGWNLGESLFLIVAGL